MNTQLAINRTEIERLIENMEAARQKAEADVNEFAATPEGLMAMDYASLKRVKDELSRSRRAADDARKAFKREWEKPLKNVEAAFKAEIAELDGLYAVYMDELNRRDEAGRQARLASLESLWRQFFADNGMPSIPESVDFQLVMARFGAKWLLKSVTQKQAEEELTQAASQILADWREVCGGNYAYPEDAQRWYLQTLSLREVREHDDCLIQDAKEREEQDRRRAQMAAEIAAAKTQKVPAPAQNPASDAATMADFGVTPQPVWRYRLTIEGTPDEIAQLVDYLKRMGIRGRVRRLHDGEAE